LYLVTLRIDRQYKKSLFRDVCVMNVDELTSQEFMGMESIVPSNKKEKFLFDQNRTEKKCVGYLTKRRYRFGVELSTFEKKKIREDVPDETLQKEVEKDVLQIKTAAQNKKHAVPYFPILWYKNDDNWLDRCYYLPRLNVVATFSLHAKNTDGKTWMLCKIYTNLIEAVANGKLLAFNENNAVFKRVEQKAVEMWSEQTE